MPNNFVSVQHGRNSSLNSKGPVEPSLQQVKDNLKAKVEDYLKTLESPIAGGKAISISKRPDSLEEKEIRSRQVIEVVKSSEKLSKSII